MIVPPLLCILPDGHFLIWRISNQPLSTELLSVEPVHSLAITYQNHVVLSSSSNRFSTKKNALNEKFIYLHHLRPIPCVIDAKKSDSH